MKDVRILSTVASHVQAVVSSRTRFRLIYLTNLNRLFYIGYYSHVWQFFRISLHDVHDEDVTHHNSMHAARNQPWLQLLQDLLLANIL
jgi:hypothetical protein